jgi:autophagy-related protein 9
MFGGVATILILLGIYDEDVFQVEHVLTIISVLGAAVIIAR